MFSKRGTYIVEAATVMPIFVAAMLLIVSLIPIISEMGDIVFSVSDELRLDQAKSGLTGEVSVGRTRMRARALAGRRVSSFRITSVRRGFEKAGIDDLFRVRFKALMISGITAIDVGSITLTGKITGRAYTGSTHEVVSDDDTICYIFPESGRKYHRKGCRYLESHCEMTYLTEEIMAAFHACPLCHASGATLGSPVFVFHDTGRAYHKANCRSVEKEKYYTEVTIGMAKASGFTACSVCGGA